MTVGFPAQPQTDGGYPQLPHGERLLDLDKLDAAVESSRKALSEARESLRGIEQSISDKKSLRKVVSDYRRTRPHH
jgi:hypothetical protein